MEQMNSRGTLYGVSVGPGEPELMTLQAVRCLERCRVIAAPRTAEGRMLALDIARGAVDLAHKTVVPLDFTMGRDEAARAAAHRAAAAAMQQHLDRGEDVAMLNLGDVSIYASFTSMQKLLQPQGYRCVRLAGVPSFCAAAAALGVSLTDGMERPLTIAPGRCAEAVLDAPGTKVLMKSGRELPAAISALEKRGLLDKSALVRSCGLPDEELWPSLAEYDTARPAGYFATILVKE